MNGSSVYSSRFRSTCCYHFMWVQEPNTLKKKWTLLYTLKMGEDQLIIDKSYSLCIIIKSIESVAGEGAIVQRIMDVRGEHSLC